MSQPTLAASPTESELTPRPIDAGVRIGHVHLKVANLERALAFYCGVLGLQAEATLRQPGHVRCGRRLPPSHWSQYLGEPGWRAVGARQNGASTISRFSIRRARRWPTPLKRLIDANMELHGVSDHGVGEALYLRDPDGNGVEFYWDQPESEWPHNAEWNRCNINEAARSPLIIT